MSNPLRPELLQRILRNHPQVGEALEAVSAIMTRAKFPIGSYADFVEMMGGPGATLTLAGGRYTLAELEQHVPSYYFPIANENDLIAKVGDFAKRVPGSGSAQMSTRRAMAEPPVFLPADAPAPNSHPPFHSLEEMHAAAGYRHVAAPGVSGLKRQPSRE